MMHRPIRGAALVASLLLLVWGGCGRAPREETEIAAPPQEGPRPESEQWDAVIRLYEEGMIRSVIDARHLAVYSLPARNYTHMDTIEADFFDEEGKSSSHLNAEAGEIYNQEKEGSRRVKTWGGVVLVGREGQTVRADTLWWDEVQDRVYTDGPVEVTEEGDVLRGIGFESDTQLTEMHIYQARGESFRAGRQLEEEREAEFARSDSTAAAPDTSAALPDSTAILPYTGGALPDSVTAPPDTTTIPPRIPPGTRRRPERFRIVP